MAPVEVGEAGALTISSKGPGLPSDTLQVTTAWNGPVQELLTVLEAKTWILGVGPLVWVSIATRSGLGGVRRIWREAREALAVTTLPQLSPGHSGVRLGSRFHEGRMPAPVTDC